jgi:hypothetical protein
MTLFRTPGRRGRPRKAKDQENAGEEVGRASLNFPPPSNCRKHRRLQLRKAQTSFRARKQQEQKARDEQLAILEATVDKLSQAFLELMDDIINSEACKQDSGVLGKLATVAAQVLALSRDKSQDDPFAELSNRNQPAISSAPEPSHANLVRLTPSTSDVSISIATPRLPTAQPSTTKQSLQLSPSNGEGAVFPEYLLTLCSPFGNGWIDQLPRFITSQDFGSSDAPAIDQSSFAFRLLNNTLQNAYWSLTGETLEHITASHRIFRFALMYHSKDELLFNLRWFLGPGIAASQVLMQKSASATVSMGDDSRLLNPNVDLAAVEHSQSGSGFVSGAYESYLSVDEIDRYLRGRNARYIDFDTIELTFPLPAYAETTLNGSTPKDSSYGK